jgi:hypothetical protein
MSDPNSSIATASVGSIRRSLSRIALEILIGFIGVYAAFALTAYKDRRDQVDRRHQIKRALITEIREIADHERLQVPGYEHFLAVYDSSVAAGKPIVRPFTESVDQQGHVWEATKASGALNLIDVPTFSMLSKFYNDYSNMYAQYAQLREISMHDILPRGYQGPSAFLDPTTKQVIPQLLVYHSGLKRIRGFSHSLSVEGDSLVKRLAKDTI